VRNPLSITQQSLLIVVLVSSDVIMEKSGVRLKDVKAKFISDIHKFMLGRHVGSASISIFIRRGTTLLVSSM